MTKKTSGTKTAGDAATDAGANSQGGAPSSQVATNAGEAASDGGSIHLSAAPDSPALEVSGDAARDAGARLDNRAPDSPTVLTVSGAPGFTPEGGQSLTLEQIRASGLDPAVYGYAPDA